MAVYTIEVPGYTPTTVNQLLAVGHWSGAYRLKGRDFQALTMPLLIARVTPARCRRRLSIMMSIPHTRWFVDPDAPFKSLLDALVRHGALVDDSSRWVELVQPECRLGPRATTITLEDLG